MINSIQPEEHRTKILAAGLDQTAVTKWLDVVEALDLPIETDAHRLEFDAKTVGSLIQQGWGFCSTLPLKSSRNSTELDAGDSLLHFITSMGRTFCKVHHDAIYRKLTGDYSKFVRVNELVWNAATLWPGIVPTKNEVEQEQERLQKDKDGLERLQGIFLSQIMADPKSGIHLLQAMLRPKAESLGYLESLQKEGVLDLNNAKIEVKGGIAYLEFKNTRYLNAEDDLSIVDQETVIDLALLHPDVKMGVIRGAKVEHPRYKGLRVFDSGINLTKIYYGKLSFLFYPNRDFGMINKLFYGLAGDEPWDDNNPDNTLEKPWIAAVDNFAIGGGCQTLLVMDYVIAESGSYFNLPARKEGIIPGAANLRLARFLGESMARQAILFDKTFYVDNPEAAGLINEVVPREQMDEAIQRNVNNALMSGMVSASGNRKALRVQQETLDTFRRYMALYCELQADCHLSSQLILNLEKHWNAKDKKLKKA